MRRQHAKLTLAFLRWCAAAFSLSSAIKRKLQLRVQTSCLLFIKCSFMSHRIAVYFYLPTRRQTNGTFYVLWQHGMWSAAPSPCGKKRLYNQLGSEVCSDAGVDVKHFPRYNTIISAACEGQLWGYEYIPFKPLHPTPELLEPFKRWV